MSGFHRLKLDLSRLPFMVARRLSDSAIARVFGCSRYTVFKYRHRLGISSRWPLRRRAEVRAREAELDRLWAALPLQEKIALLLQCDAARSGSRQRIASRWDGGGPEEER